MTGRAKTHCGPCAAKQSTALSSVKGLIANQHRRRGPVSLRSKIISWSMITWTKPTLFKKHEGIHSLEVRECWSRTRGEHPDTHLYFGGGTTTDRNQAAIDPFVGSLLAWEDRGGLLQIRKQKRKLESYVKNMYIKISATDCLSINPWPKAFSARGCQMKKSYENN